MPDPALPPPLPMPPKRRRPFHQRFLLALALSGVLIAISLSIGILGYHFIVRLSWVDSLLNAAMILSGMGPVNALNSDAAKVFASLYALFAGIIFITVTGIVLSPMFHRVLHRFHLEQQESR